MLRSGETWDANFGRYESYMWFGNAKRIDVRMYVSFYEQLFFREYCICRWRHVHVNSKNGYEEIIFSLFRSTWNQNVNTMNANEFRKLEYVTILVSFEFSIGQWRIFFLSSILNSSWDNINDPKQFQHLAALLTIHSWIVSMLWRVKCTFKRWSIRFFSLLKRI